MIVASVCCPITATDPPLHQPTLPADARPQFTLASAISRAMADNEVYEDLHAGDLEGEGGGAEDMVDAAAVRLGRPRAGRGRVPLTA